jgi:translation initiation factor IF-3
VVFPAQEVNAIRRTRYVPQPRQPQQRINDRIRVPQVRVIADDGEQLGVLATKDAIEIAKAKGLDLVEVAGNVRPPVCRILDFGKYKYEQNRKARQARKKQHQTQVKEVKMRPKIDEHDYNFKLQHAREFLLGRDKVKLTIMFRGRENAHPEMGRKLIARVVADLESVAAVEAPARSEGRTMIAVLSPRSTKSGGGAPKAKSEASKPKPKPATSTPRPKPATSTPKPTESKAGTDAAPDGPAAS